MADYFDTIYTELENHIEVLKSKYINKHIVDRTTTPEDFDFDVKAYCVLCHAAFEDFFENIALQTLDQSIENFERGKSNRAIITLMHFKVKPIDLLHDRTNEIIISFDYIREKLKEAKKAFSVYIEDKNHGIRLKNLNNMLTPLSLNLKNETKYLESLDKLASERGHYAHRVKKRKSFIKSVSPEDSIKLVNDCLILCSDLKEKAKKLLE